MMRHFHSTLSGPILRLHSPPIVLLHLPFYPLGINFFPSLSLDWVRQGSKQPGYPDSRPRAEIPEHHHLFSPTNFASLASPGLLYIYTLSLSTPLSPAPPLIMSIDPRSPSTTRPRPTNSSSTRRPQTGVPSTGPLLSPAQMIAASWQRETESNKNRWRIIDEQVERGTRQAMDRHHSRARM